MEIHFSELEESNYWEKPKEEKEKRKKVSFNDILSNMNLVVNNEGVLQLMVPNQPPTPNAHAPPLTHAPPPNAHAPVEHSYIYNKYFKDYYKEEEQAPKVPQTIEEYRQMVLEDIARKKRIEEIKSKKLLFTIGPDAQANPRHVVSSRNNLRRMNFG